MNIATIILIIAGLSVFEIINSIDNAIINANVLSTMHARYRRLFLYMGMFFAVFVVRGLLPWLLIWISNPSLGPLGAFTSVFSGNPQILQNIENSSPLLLVGAAVFLFFLFFHWLFFEPKRVVLSGERFLQSNFYLFYAIMTALLAAIVWLSLQKSKMMAFAAISGAVLFYIVEVIKGVAEKHHLKLYRDHFSDLSKILYLEVIDATFSIDGVTGAFAFTLSVPLILIGNGIGALVVRQLTIKNFSKIRKFKYLKKGAMYSIFIVAIIMLLESFGLRIPIWLLPALTFAIVGYFFRKSEEDLKAEKERLLKLKI